MQAATRIIERFTTCDDIPTRSERGVPKSSSVACFGLAGAPSTGSATPLLLSQLNSHSLAHILTKTTLRAL